MQSNFWTIGAQRIRLIFLTESKTLFIFFIQKMSNDLKPLICDMCQFAVQSVDNLLKKDQIDAQVIKG